MYQNRLLEHVKVILERAEANIAAFCCIPTDELETLYNLLTKTTEGRTEMNEPHYDYIRQRARLHRIGEIIADLVADKDEHYGSSWRRRGGVGAFMIIARKWDRIEEFCQNTDTDKGTKYDLFECFSHDIRAEGITDDVIDLIGYLMILLEYQIEEGHVLQIGRTQVIDDPVLNPKVTERWANQMVEKKMNIEEAGVQVEHKEEIFRKED